MAHMAFLEAALLNTNVQAFMQMIRHCEGTSAVDGYEYLFGCTPKNKMTFNDFSKHPNRRTPYTNKAGKSIISTAAGAYQILYGTWKGLTIILGLKDFSPHTQDLMCVELLSQKNCLQRLMDGDFTYALCQAKIIWASLPGAGVDQPEKTLAEVQKYYSEAGGIIA